MNFDIIPGVSLHAHQRAVQRFGRDPTRSDWLAAVASILDRAAMLLGIRVLDAEAVDRTLGSVLKYREDQDLARAEGLAWVASGA